MTFNHGAVKLSGAVFCHSSRLTYATKLASALSAQGLNPWLIVDDTGCWNSARQAWKAMSPEATHHIILADDCGLCKNFVLGVAKAIEAVPDEAICYFDTKQIVQRALDRQDHWMRMNKAIGLANSLPANMVAPFLRWERANFRSDCPHDDERLSAYLMREDRYCWHTVPSLVQHLLPNDSIMGHHPPIKRTAWAFDENFDAAAADWTRGRDDPITEARFDYKKVYRKEMRH